MERKSLASASAWTFWNSRLTSRIKADEFAIRGQGKDGETGTNLPGSIVDRAQSPGFRHHFDESGTQRGRARVARLQAVK